MKVCLRCGRTNVEHGILCDECLKELENGKTNRVNTEDKQLNDRRKMMSFYTFKLKVNSIMTFLAILLMLF